MSTGVWVLLGAVVLAVGFGLYRAFTDGRFRGTHALPIPETVPMVEPRGGSADERVETTAASLLDATPWADELGERATLLQFSSAFCAPCRTTRHVLGDIASRTPGVTHVEIDAEKHLDLVRRLGIMRTPTTLVLDGSGSELMRATGAPRAEQVATAIESIKST